MIAGVEPAALRELAESLARDAGDLARARREDGVAIAATKSTVADIVTEADRAAEELIRESLRTLRPDDGFLGEESEQSHGTSGLTWVVDPIDGTVNYAYGLPVYAVSVAVVVGEPRPGAWSVIAAAVYAPVLDEMSSAHVGGGATLNGRPTRVRTEPAAGALLATGFGYDPATHGPDLDTVKRVMPIARDLRRGGSAAIDLASVAAGRLDGYFERGLKPWDHAAGELLVTEAGGLVTIIDERADRPMLVAAEPTTHVRLRSILEEERPV